MSIVSSSVKIYSDSTLQTLVATVSGTTAATQTIAVTGLNTSTQYWAQAEATDNNGLTGFSSSFTFTTAAANYTFQGIVGYSSVYDTLDCDIQVSCPGATFTECGIQFCTASDFSGSIISGSNTTSPADDFVDEVSGFAENTTYYYRFYATSTQYGTQYHAPQNNSITTHYDEPTLTITTSNITDTTATISLLYTGNMPVDASAMSAVYVVHNSQQSPTYLQLDHLTAGTPEVFNLSGLTPNTQYDVSWDVDYYTGEVSQLATFTTLPARPTVVISSVTNVTPSSANVNITIS